MRVLVADDDPITKKLVMATLGRDRFVVQGFDDGLALWEEYEREPCELVVTDWMMPRLDGVALCRRIREEKLTVHTHVVLVTSLSSREKTLEAYRAGVDDFIGKPFEPELLSLQVAAAARGLRAAAEAGARRSLEVCQRVLGSDDAALLDVLDDLVSLSREQKSFVRCRAFLRRQLDIAMRAFGPRDQRTRDLSMQLEEMMSWSEAI